MMLRPYQERALREVHAAWEQGARRICLVMPTGAGKTRTAEAITAGLDAMWLVHRVEIADQAPGRAVTIQGLLGSGERPACDVLVVDEVHHAAGASAAQWHAVAQHYPRILGLTATPERGDGSPLGDLLDALVVGATYRELLDGGWIVPARVYRPSEELQGLATDPAAAWRQWRPQGARGLAFFSRVESAEAFAREISGCRGVSGTTPAAERAASIAAFRAGDVDVLSSVQCLTEGLDLPEASVALIARGCQHAGAWLQMVGRVLRAAPGKTHATVIDLAGVSHRLGLPDEDREYSLAGRAIRQRVPSLSVCQRCGRTHPSSDGRCPGCGWQPDPRPARIRIWDVPLCEVGAEQRAAMTPEQLSKIRARERWAAMGEGARRAELARLRAAGAARGFKPQWAAIQFKIRFGRWP